MMGEIEVLDSNGFEICKKIAQAGNIAKNFYLAGGTALALQLKHRKSYDLDFFQVKVSEKIDFENIYYDLINLFRQKEIKIIMRQIDQATFSIYGTKVSFIAYPFSLVEPLVSGDIIDPNLEGINLASAKEIALMKAYTIGRRPTYRDYIDLYFLLKKNIVTLEYILEKAPQKFVIEGEAVFSRKLFLEQLMYTEDIYDKETALASIIGEKLDAEELEQFLAEQAKKAIEKYVKKKG
ncbi:nucleotidyl transferase AbiEii/AbiGii toxin family protein [Thermoanaerobacter uzonensis]|uniref:nucleotidyl transferase AbiEii/AbiGii toxin family protein n=1 Tax=Thermoanaerobacter uzonensis TaxID=447593 RepID=UPI003D766F4F